MLWSSTRPHCTVLGRQTKAAQLESHPCCADPQCTVYIGIACVVATRTESSALPCSIALHNTHRYAVTVALGWKAGSRRKELGLEMVMQW